ncbi:MAG TPA: LLM class flavin-dependent oxidoreductase [Novosphingobium sp.]|nr:LLM class flavin-dependent oxidoreductase [Novosphingobium sp.]
MALSFYWTLSTTATSDRRRAEWADGDRPWTPARDAGSRRLQINHYDYLTQVARAAELTGFDGLVIPDEPEGEEPWIVTGALLRETRRLQLVTAIAPGSASGVYHAKMAASVQRFSGDRQGWLIDGARGLAAGDAVAAQDSAARTGELLTLLEGLWGDGPFDQEGEHFIVEKGGLGGLVKGRRRPPVWLRQSQAPGADLLGHADVLLLDGAPPVDALADLIADTRRANPALRLAATVPLLTRADGRDVAVEAAYRDPAPAALVGTYDAVAERLRAFAAAGLDIAVLSAPDQIHEVHVAGEQVVGRVRALATAA